MPSRLSRSCSSENPAQSCGGRRVSRSEALRIVQAIGERAERERLEAAEQEAARGIHWEDEG